MTRKQPDPTRRVTSIALAVVVTITCASRAGDVRVYEQGKRPDDVRLQPPKNLNGYFPFQVPANVAAWETRADHLRRQVKVATGLWPLPPRTPLNSVMHGLVKRPGFTVEKVYFESMPNHYVTGLLFRPDDGKKDVKRPVVLCPHGHGGRTQDYGVESMAQLIDSGAERFARSGRFPKIARCTQLARMGCVVFIFDMLGYVDSNQISRQLAHDFAEQRPDFEGKESWGFFSTQAEMRLQSIMGIQTWNGIRSLDFLEKLPDVDSSRIAVTGGSGGGTQTILLCAIDPRPIAAFPNGMVSTAMQGGCTCENCSLLRVDSGNVELAALFAPKPQAMTAANDWTKEMMTKGYPELQRLYEMLGVPDNVYCRPLLHFPHNYNYVSRSTMYAWFNKHLKLGLKEPIVETDFEPLTSVEYTVWDAMHPQPKGGDAYERNLTRYLADQSDKQIEQLIPAQGGSLDEYREVVGGAFQTIIGRGLPSSDDIQRKEIDKKACDGYLFFKDIVRLQPRGEELPVISLFPVGTKWNGQMVLWLDGAGKSGLMDESRQPQTQVRRLLDSGISVVSPDLFQQGEFLLDDMPVTQQRVVKNPRQAAAYTFCYNDTLFARRVHDVLTVAAWIRSDDHTPKQLHLVAMGGSGPVAAAARAIAGDTFDKAAIDTGGFRFADLTSYRHVDFLPGAVKYGDLPALLALSAPRPLWLLGEKGRIPTTVRRVYAAAGSSKAVSSSDEQASTAAAVNWLLDQ